MSACTPTRPTDPPPAHRSHPPHSPPPDRRFRIAGADLSASITVFLIALPLSLGIALATGAPLQSGLVAAAVGGLVTGRLGGSPLQVSGPAAGLTVVTADLIQRYGWRTTCAITVLAGLVQLGLGCLRVARTALAVSPAIVHGMLAGIGVTIAVAQLHIVLGGSPQSSVPDNVRALPAQLADLHPGAVTVSVLTLTLLLLWPRLPGRTGRLLRIVPAPLVAVAGATATAALAGLTLPQVELPSWRSHALAGLPEGPVLGLLAAVLTVTLVCSVQSLLGAVAVDRLAASRPAPAVPVRRSDLDRELLGQGSANIVSGALGGLPVAGVAVRSTANVNAGAVSRNSTMLHGVLVVVAALLMVPILERIPLASLAALVMAVGIQMVSLHHIRTVTRHREVLVYATTLLGVIFLGVLQGVALGIAVAVGTALHRLTRTRISHDEQEGVHHVRVRGQLTFLAVPRLSRALHLVPQGAHAVVELDGSFMDHAAYESLQDWQKTHTAQGGTVEFTGRRAGLTGTPEGGSGDPASGPAGSGDATGAAGPARAGGPAEVAAPVGLAAATHCRCRPWTPWRNHQCEPMLAALEPTPPAGRPDAVAHADAAGRADAGVAARRGSGGAAAAGPAGGGAGGVGAGAGPGTADGAGCGGGTDGMAHGHPAGGVAVRGGDAGGGTAGRHAAGAGTAAGGPVGAGHGGGGPGAHGRTGHGAAGHGAAGHAPVGLGTGRRGGHRLARGIRVFQRNTAPLVRAELARLAREGQRPSQLFLTCADSRLVTSMITASGPGDLFVVRNVGNLVPLPGAESGDDSVAAAIEYAVEVLQVRSITVCGHSGCGAMQALLRSEPGEEAAGETQTPLRRWLRHGVPSLERMADDSRPWARLAGRHPTDAVEQLCLTNVVQQLEHLRAHESVARALEAGVLELHGMYFHVGEAQAYLLTEAKEGQVFDQVREEDDVPA
ncbi:bifunctional SulP family inorganic anion transporter/carbonic anhydrase [Streptomyces sp. NPDC057386]|uniref:bifunctional SulP family inorganic anion transporter/carbonic anhydrase n=1 Tax=unclassified Streptomyces TaxID=2593676 RepID=UPI00364525A7